MSTIKVEPGKLGVLLKAKVQGSPEALLEGMVAAAQRGRSLLVRKSPVDTGHFKNAWRVASRASKAGWLDRAIGNDESFSLENDAPHAGVIERGARPHKVNRAGVDAIRAWVRRVMGGRLRSVARQRKEYGGKRATIKSLQERAIDEVTWAIIKKIERDGQKGLFLVRDSLPELRRFLDLEIKRAMRRHFDEDKP